MASLQYDSFKYRCSTGTIDLDSDTFYMLLVTSSYTPNQGTHVFRSDITNEVSNSGTNYTTGGAALTTVVVTNDTTNHRTKFASDDVSWATATFTARAGVIYKHRGGASSADELVCYLDFTTDKTATAGTFLVQCPANGWCYLG